MPIDFTKPAITDNYSSAFVPNITNAINALGMMLDAALAGTITSPPTGTKRYNAGRFQQWSGVAWGDVAIGGVYFDGTSVGVGTTAPTFKFHVVDATDARIALNGSGAGTSAGGAAYFYRTSALAGTVGVSANRLNDSTLNLLLAAEQSLVFASGGATERARFDATGRFGVGGSPAYKLDVRDDSTSVVARFLNNTAGAGSEVYFSANDRNLIIGQTSSTSASAGLAYVYTGFASPIAFSTSAVERLRISAGGDIGVGTAAPGFRFDVASPVASVAKFKSATTSAIIRFADSTADTGYVGSGTSLVSGITRAEFGITANTGALVFGTGTTERARVSAAGLMGIGVTAPAFRLDVADDIAVRAGGRRVLLTAGAGSLAQLLVDGAIPLVLGTADTERLRITAAGVIQDAAGIELGYKQVPRSASAGGTLSGRATYNGKCIAASGAITIPASDAVAGDVVSIYNDSAAAIAITQGAGLTLRIAGTTTTGSRTLAARGMATVWFNSATEAVISGAGLT